MAHRVIKKVKLFEIKEISYSAQSNQKNWSLKKLKISYSWFLMAHRVIKKKKKKLLEKNIISYGAQSNQKFEAFLK